MRPTRSIFVAVCGALVIAVGALAEDRRTTTYSGSRGLSGDFYTQHALCARMPQILTYEEYAVLAPEEQKALADELAAGGRQLEARERVLRGRGMDQRTREFQEMYEVRRMQEVNIRAKAIQSVAARLPESRRAFYVAMATPYMRIQMGNDVIARQDASARIAAVLDGAGSEEELLKRGLKLEPKKSWLDRQYERLTR